MPENLAVCLKATNQMWTKGDRYGFVQVLVNGDPTTGERRAQLAALQLPDLVGETHRVIARDDALVLQ